MTLISGCVVFELWGGGGGTNFNPEPNQKHYQSTRPCCAALMYTTTTTAIATDTAATTRPAVRQMTQMTANYKHYYYSISRQVVCVWSALRLPVFQALSGATKTAK
eukprot:1959743-Amphidinium_carterae.1